MQVSFLFIRMTCKSSLCSSQFFGVSKSDSSLCLVTQFYDGGSLYELLHSTQDIKPEDLDKIIRGITAGMMHLVNALGCFKDFLFTCSFSTMKTLSIEILLHATSCWQKITKPKCQVRLNAEDLSLTVGCTLDFGLSRFASKGEGTTFSDVGPLKHMAPECLLSRSYSFKSDGRNLLDFKSLLLFSQFCSVWAYGVTLFEIYER